jgi:hypothetical protein
LPEDSHCRRIGVLVRAAADDEVTATSPWHNRDEEAKLPVSMI